MISPRSHDVSPDSARERAASDHFGSAAGAVAFAALGFVLPGLFYLRLRPPAHGHFGAPTAEPAADTTDGAVSITGAEATRVDNVAPGAPGGAGEAAPRAAARSSSAEGGSGARASSRWGEVCDCAVAVVLIGVGTVGGVFGVMSVDWS